MSTIKAQEALKTQFAGTNAGKQIAETATTRAKTLSSMSVHTKKPVGNTPATGANK